MHCQAPFGDLALNLHEVSRFYFGVYCCSFVRLLYASMDDKVTALRKLKVILLFD